MNVYIYIFVLNTRYSDQILMKLEYSRQIFENYSNIKFHENSFSGSRVVPYGRVDTQTVVLKWRL